jgi:hypothetical protein
MSIWDDIVNTFAAGASTPMMGQGAADAIVKQKNIDNTQKQQQLATQEVGNQNTEQTPAPISKKGAILDAYAKEHGKANWQDWVNSAKSADWQNVFKKNKEIADLYSKQVKKQGYDVNDTDQVKQWVFDWYARNRENGGLTTAIKEARSGDTDRLFSYLGTDLGHITDNGVWYSANMTGFDSSMPLLSKLKWEPSSWMKDPLTGKDDQLDRTNQMIPSDDAAKQFAGQFFLNSFVKDSDNNLKNINPAMIDDITGIDTGLEFANVNKVAKELPDGYVIPPEQSNQLSFDTALIPEISQIQGGDKILAASDNPIASNEPLTLNNVAIDNLSKKLEEAGATDVALTNLNPYDVPKTGVKLRPQNAPTDGRYYDEAMLNSIYAAVLSARPEYAAYKKTVSPQSAAEMSAQEQGISSSLATKGQATQDVQDRTRAYIERNR